LKRLGFGIGYSVGFFTDSSPVLEQKRVELAQKLLLLRENQHRIAFHDIMTGERFQFFDDYNPRKVRTVSSETTSRRRGTRESQQEQCSQYFSGIAVLSSSITSLLDESARAPTSLGRYCIHSLRSRTVDELHFLQNNETQRERIRADLNIAKED
jgi:hypothetical protein